MVVTLFAPFAPFLILSMWPLYSHVWRVGDGDKYGCSLSWFICSGLLFSRCVLRWLVGFTYLVLHPRFRHPPHHSVVSKDSKKKCDQPRFFLFMSFLLSDVRQVGSYVVNVESIDIAIDTIWSKVDSIHDCCNWPIVIFHGHMDSRIHKRPNRAGVEDIYPVTIVIIYLGVRLYLFCLPNPGPRELIIQPLFIIRAVGFLPNHQPTDSKMKRGSLFLAPSPHLIKRC